MTKLFRDALTSHEDVSTIHLPFLLGFNEKHGAQLLEIKYHLQDKAMNRDHVGKCNFVERSPNQEPSYSLDANWKKKIEEPVVPHNKVSKDDA